MEPVVIIGIGNDFRGDDAAGLMVADRLMRAGCTAKVARHSGDGAGLLGLWEGAETVVLVDAVVSGAAPGKVLRLDGLNGIPRAWFGASTHTINVAEAIDLARTMGRMPAKLVIYGIEGERFEPGEPPSNEVLHAVERVTNELAALAIPRLPHPLERQARTAER